MWLPGPTTPRARDQGEDRENFFYEESNRLKLTYFPDNQKVDKNQLEECFIGKRWKSDEDVVKSVVLYFIYTFLLSAVANRVYVHIKGVDGDEDGNAGIDLSYSKGKMKNEFCSVEKVACENVIDSSDALEGRVHNEMISENDSNQDIKYVKLVPKKS
ncbi:hypothetical protein MTR67_051480 [Solanum verrucosum]|uniref:Uncharacterized protein n=1 Tax=Solanum verrucosum TaxID=315347 RepID=A0AAF0V571_SOLVR|nr:hypothetical protein MTR67_051480 [Solanum verrucosum]